MLNDNAKKWVAALRSGKYKQGYGCLREGGRFCCLGVACDIFDSDEWQSANFFMDEDLILPTAVRDWLGLQDVEGTHGSGDTLTYINDSGKNFSEIADIIESEPEGLFKK